jgi:hypothetical protein
VIRAGYDDVIFYMWVPVMFLINRLFIPQACQGFKMVTAGVWEVGMLSMET